MSLSKKESNVCLTHEVGGPYSSVWFPILQTVQLSTFFHMTWNLSKILHDRIFGPKILHTKSAYNATFFATIKQRLCEHWWSLLLKLKWICIISIVLKEMCVKLPKSCVNFIFLCKFDMELHCFPEKNYTAGKNFTRPPVATNFKSEHQPIKETLECSLKMTHFPKPWYYSKGDIRSERASNISNSFKGGKIKRFTFPSEAPWVDKTREVHSDAVQEY